MKLTAALLALCTFAACKTTPDYNRPLPPGAPALIPLGPDEKKPEIASQFAHRDDILPALERSIGWTRSKHAKQYFPMAGIDHQRAVASLERFRDLLLSARDEREFTELVDREFTVYKSAGWNAKGGGVLFTGYCTPILKGSTTRAPGYDFPLYRLPPDLVKNEQGEILGRKTASGLEPYPTRRTIEASHMFAGQNLEVVWLTDPLDAYIAHVNGSAFVEMPNGEMFKLGYAGKNGRAYTSLGQELIKDGQVSLDEMSLAKIRQWAAEHPKELDEYLARNDSYVFFTPIEGNPRGCLNVEVSTRRSIATDKELFPRAALTFVETKSGVGPSLACFMFDQDRGGAIRTAGRADVYLGIGPEAEQEAGTLRQEGQLYYYFLAEGTLPAP